MIRQHNLEVKKTGQGVFWDERVTDNDESVSVNNFYKSLKKSAHHHDYRTVDPREIFYFQGALWFTAEIV